MAITVGDIYTAFPTFKPKDMIDLMGTEKFNGRSEVSLSKIAHYKGGMAKELSVFTAKKEGKSYTNMLSQTERQNVSEKANINADGNKQDKKPVPQNIPMDTSVFDVNKKQV
ncbi:MAG: hypothetical protein NC390_01130 [Fusobacterium sp.]|nr:hypothetical protein [Fusobacterium sp.]